MLVPLEVGICCVDLDEVSRFYQDALGFTFVSQEQVPASDAQRVGLSELGYKVKCLQTSYGERLKLLAPQRKPTLCEEGLVLDRLNASYLTFTVEDIASLVPGLHAAGASFFTSDAPIQVRPHMKALFCRDPVGNVLELVEYTDITAYRPDLFNDRSA
jgi:catechol 2,3-dioxygenase-like lactoylglutathione lyase family enzyme